MDLWKHFCASAILAAMLFPLVGWMSLFSYVTGFFIDIDHIIYYVCRHRKADLAACYAFFKGISKNNRQQYLVSMRWFHYIEFGILLIFLSYLHPAFFVLAVSFFVHILMDMIEEERIFGFIKNYSLFEVLSRKRGKKNKS